MPARRRALLVAVDSYDDPRLPKLVTPRRDAEALAEVLADPSRGAFDVEIMVNATYWAVTERLEDILATSGGSDDVLLHFGCHGLKDDGGGLYLAAGNTRANRLVSTGIDSVTVLRMMRASPAASVVLFLDCCFGGAFARGMLARTADGLDLDAKVDEAVAGGRGLAVLTASSATEWAFEKDGPGRRGAPGASVFTRAVVEGIRSGDADRNEDGRISLDELYEYVARRVKAESPRQTPHKWEFGVRESLFIARSPRRRVVPAELSAEISRLLTDRLPGVRRLGVQELVTQAQGTDLPAALTARLLLGKLAVDDSRVMSDAAVQGLAQTQLHVSPARVDLGLTRPGAGTEPAVVRLGGLPLAQLSQVQADPGIRAWIEGDRLLITSTGTGPGLLAGSVVLTGPAGAATVEVAGWTLPDPAPLLDRAFRTARTAVGDPRGEALVLVLLALVAEQAGEADRVARMLAPVPDLLRAITEPTERAPAAAAYAWMLARSGDEEGAAHHVGRARDFLAGPEPAAPAASAVVPAEPQDADEPDPDRELAALAVDWSAALIGSPDGPADVWNRVRAVIDAGEDDREDRMLALFAGASVLAAAGHAELAGEAFTEAEEAGDGEPNLDMALIVSSWIRIRFSEPGRARQLIDALAEGIAGFEGVDKGLCFAYLGWLAGQAGDDAGGLLYVTEALKTGRDPGTGHADRVTICLAAGWVAAHLGHHDLGMEAAAVVDEPVPEDYSPQGRVTALIVAALVAAMAGRHEEHDRWLLTVEETVGELDDDWDEAAAGAAVVWVSALLDPEVTSAGFIAWAVGFVRDQLAEDTVAATIATLALVLLGAWSRPPSHPAPELSGEAAELLAGVEADLEGDELDEWFRAAAAWVAVQAGDRERALRLIGGIMSSLGDDDDGDPLAEAVYLAALAWVFAVGDHLPHPLLHDLARVLLPTEQRTTRTSTLFSLLTATSALLLPGA